MGIGTRRSAGVFLTTVFLFLLVPSVQAENLIENAGFEDGVSAFTTDYALAVGPCGLFPEGTYAVDSTTLTNRADGSFYPVWGQTGVGTNFFMANGSSNTSDVVWQAQSIIQVTEADTAYRFEAYVCSLVDIGAGSASPQLSFELGDGTDWIDMGTTVVFPIGTDKGDWQLFYVDGKFSDAGNYFVHLTNNQSAAGGNDFGLDTIYFWLSSESPSVDEHPVDNPPTYDTSVLNSPPNIDLDQAFYTVTQVQNNQVGRTFEGGTLQVDVGGQTIGADFIVQPLGGTINTNGNDLTISGNMFGDGGLTKTGAGNLTLSGANTFAGGMDLTTGGISLGHDTALGTNTLTVSGNASLQSNDNARSVSNNITVNGGNTLTVNGGNNLTLGGVIGGGGGLTKDGVGNLTLSGANNYTGGTTVQAGTLTGNTTSLQGNILNNAAVSFDQLLDGTYAGVISGSGILGKSGAGNLTLTGANTYTGGLTVSAGTVTGASTSLQGAITNAAAVVFDQAGDGTYAGVMDGTGTLTKTGEGTLTLSGLNIHTGDTNLQVGIVNLSGSVGGNLNVNGGTLMGNGIVGNDLTINVGGTVAPGNSIGVTTVVGDFVLNGIYDAEVSKLANGTLLADLVDASGSATLNAGSEIRVTELPAGGVILNEDAFRVIATGGGITDLGTTVASQSAFLEFTGEVNGNDYYVIARRISNFTAQASGGNNRQVAQALDSDSHIATGDYANVMNSLLMLSTPQFNQAARQLTPEPVLVQQQVMVRNTQRQAEQLANYLSHRRKPGGETQLGWLNSNSMLASTESDSQAVADAVAMEKDDTALRIFAKPFSAMYNEDTSSDRLGFRGSAYGAQFGIDRQFMPGLILGLFTSVADTKLHYKEHRGNGDIFSVQVGPYATISHKKFSFDIWAGYGFHRNETERDILFGNINRQANAHYNAHTGSIYLGSQYDFDVRGCTLSPMASLQYIYTHQDAVRESGANALDLRISQNDAHSLRSRLGLRFSRSFDALGVTWTPEVLGGWAYEYLNDQSLTSRFSDGAAMFITTPGSQGSSVYAGAALGVEFNPNVTLTARYETEFSHLIFDNWFNLGLKFKF